MNYQFPHLTNIKPIELAVAGRDEFIIAERDDYIVVNYNYQQNDTFDIDDTQSAKLIKDARGNYHPAGVYLRECRGLIFDKHGNLMSRPFHKFFNFGEREETHYRNLPRGFDATLFDKMDGSMIRPIIIDGFVRLATKMGITKVSMQAEEWLVRHNPEAFNVLKMYVGLGYTPLFEWCSPNNRIVVRYQHPQLFLLAIRDNYSGEYRPPSELMNEEKHFPIAPHKPTDISNLEGFVRNAREEDGKEGYIVRYDNGHMIKIKNDWYVKIHKVKAEVSNDRNILILMLAQGLDDVLPVLDQEDVEYIRRFEKEFWFVYAEKLNYLNQRVRYIVKTFEGDRKRIALEGVNILDDKSELRYVFGYLDGRSVNDQLFDAVQKSLSNNRKFDDMKTYLGMKDVHQQN